MAGAEKILKTAWKLYKKTDGKLPAVSLIAQKTGLSKGAVYLYFKTKDEIFLHLFIHQLREWHEYVSNATATANDKLHIVSLKNLDLGYAKIRFSLFFKLTI